MRPRHLACSIATRGHPHTASADTRHSYVTHSIEDGVDPKFIQEQVGHLYASTTALYTAVSSDFANTMMLKAIGLAFDNDPGDRALERSGRR
ncbi:tyrosine-type recombinase/integrase [Streptomyces sp. NPDC060333]|uniref:tyrosine-type recombinase/integrase n=1 Tax=Streptomyces sp. NPDC060333 TaxID=3347098 RepID=UPI0036531AA8